MEMQLLCMASGVSLCWEIYQNHFTLLKDEKKTFDSGPDNFPNLKFVNGDNICRAMSNRRGRAISNRRGRATCTLFSGVHYSVFI